MGSPIDNSSGLLNWPNMPQYGPMMMNNSRMVAGLYALGLVGTGIDSHDKKQKNCQVLPRDGPKTRYVLRFLQFLHGWNGEHAWKWHHPFSEGLLRASQLLLDLNAP